MEVDLIPLSQLPSRYGIARSNLYNRLKDLQIEPIKQGRKAFVSAAQLQLLDRLHSHLQEGKVTSEFIAQQQSNISLVTVATPELEANTHLEMHNRTEPMLTLQPSALVSVVEAVVKRLIPVPRTRLNYLRELEEAYQNEWLLSTSEIADLLGLSQKTVTSYGQEFSDAGFVFTRVGIRKGGEIAWAIDKQTDASEPVLSSTTSIKQAFSSAFDPDDE
jgi:DNA-binding Lrp family transcriptional regulator